MTAGLVVVILFGLVAWLAIAFGTAAVANGKGRDPIAWWFAGAFLGLLGLLIAALLPPLDSAAPAGPTPSRGVFAGASPVATPAARCPFCAESIQPLAVICRYCGRDLPEGPHLVQAALQSADVSASAASQTPLSKARQAFNPASWTPSHQVPTGGMVAWVAPPSGGATQRVDLEAGRMLRVEATDGVWAVVTDRSGWAGSVDRRLLEPLPGTNGSSPS